MHIESEGIETGDPGRPFVARITIGTKKKRELLAEFEAPSLAAAKRDADAWMAEYCARVGLGDPKLLTPEVMRSRWDRMRDGMPHFPEPGEAYCRALEKLAFAGDDPDVTDDSTFTADPTPRRGRTRASYPTRSKIVGAVAAARAADIDVAGIRVWPDGSIAVFDSRGIIEKQPAVQGDSAYEEWKAGRE